MFTLRTTLRNVSALAIILSFPAASIAVFGYHYDKEFVSHVLSTAFTILLYLHVLSAFAPGSRGRRLGTGSISSNSNKKISKGTTKINSSNRVSASPSRQSQYYTTELELDELPSLEACVIQWVRASASIHCTWELGWLLLHKQIAADRYNPIFYPWTAYADGGDARYNTIPLSTLLLLLEVLSIVNGCVGFGALRTWFLHKTEHDGASAKRTRSLSLILFTVMATYHFASCSMYFLSEVVEGFPNVNTDSPFDLWVKFFLVNSPWLVFPWFVLRFVYVEIVKM